MVRKLSPRKYKRAWGLVNTQGATDFAGHADSTLERSLAHRKSPSGRRPLNERKGNQFKIQPDKRSDINSQDNLKEIH